MNGAAPMDLPLLALPDAPRAADTAGQRDEDGYTVEQLSLIHI